MPQSSIEPIHIAIIPDGNRRWAKKRTLQPWRGHEEAMKNLHDLTEAAYQDPRISTLTVWAFSTENWKRSQPEIKMLMSLIQQYLEAERGELIKNKIRFTHSGRKDRIPASLKKIISDIEKETDQFDKFTLNLALDYGAKDELTRAIARVTGRGSSPAERLDRSNATRSRRAGVKARQAPSEKEITLGLDHPEIPDIDLIIRTGGEQRLSNFFLWQSAYAELYFIEKFFPDFNAKDLDKAVAEFERRQRRYGN